MNKNDVFYVQYWIFGNCYLLHYPAITNIVAVNQIIRYNGVFAITKEMVLQQKLVEKDYVFVKMPAPAMVWPASSDFWKAPFDFIIKWTAKGFFVDKERNNYISYLGESNSFSFWGNHC